MMVKIKIEGPNAKFTSALVGKALLELGLKVNRWTNVTPSEVAGCRREATKQKADVSIVAMSR